MDAFVSGATSGSAGKKQVTKYIAKADSPEEIAALYEKLSGKKMSPEGLAEIREIIVKAKAQPQK